MILNPELNNNLKLRCDNGGMELGEESDVVVCANPLCAWQGCVILLPVLPHVFKSEREVRLAGTCSVCNALYVKYEDEEIATDA